jgi:hypothetical protein
MGYRAIALAAVLGASTLSIAHAAPSCDVRVTPSCANYPILNPGESVETETAQPRSPLRISAERRAKKTASKRGRHAARIASAKRKLKQARRERTKVAAVSKRRGARPGVTLTTIAKRTGEVEVASAQDDLTFDQPAIQVAMPRPKPAALSVAEVVPFNAPTPEEEAAAQSQAVEAIETTGGTSLEERVAEAVISSAQASTPKLVSVIPATVRPAEFASAAAPGQFDLTPLRTAFLAFGGLLVLGTVARLMIA